MQLFSKGGEFSPVGRLSRLAYFKRMSLATILYKAVEEELPKINSPDEHFATVSVILFTMYFAFTFIIEIKRLHDLNLSGFWAIPIYIVALFALFGALDKETELILVAVLILISLALTFTKGTAGPNRFGDDLLPPKTV